MFYKQVVRPILFRQDPETVHDWTLQWLRRVGEMPLVPSLIRTFCSVNGRGRLEQRLFDLKFPNPIGLAAGMDKNGMALESWQALGFGFLEIGAVTALEQEGNPTPRVFRLPTDKALINRMGFNNQGADKIAANLAGIGKLRIPLGINIGKSKVVPTDDIKAVINDYCYTLKTLHGLGDFFVLNVSSPNTPGLRELQYKNFLGPLLDGIKEQQRRLPQRKHQRTKPLLLKIAPDLTLPEIDEVLELITDFEIDGIVAVNTTTKRDGLCLKTDSEVVKETGGLSGLPLKHRALEVVRYIRQKKPFLPIIGVGGISSAEDAYGMLNTGANLIQLCTGLVYEGPLLVHRINRKLCQFMKNECLGSVEAFNLSTNRS